MMVVMKKFQEHDILKDLHNDCCICEVEPDQCNELKSCVQSLMSQGVIHFSKEKVSEEISTIEPITIVYRKKQIEVPMKKSLQPISICVPRLFPFQSTKVMPWRYDTNAYMRGRSIQFSKSEIVNIVGTGGMIQSGCVFTSKFTPKSVSPIVNLPQRKEWPNILSSI